MVDPHIALADLAKRAIGCRRCSQVATGSAVIGPANGSVPAPILFVAEAPGYLGGVRYGVPLWGDRTGKNFRAYCAQTGIDLDRAFITNAVLCHPPSPDGRNRTPRRSEMHACRDFLVRQIELVDPSLIVTLGRIALDSLDLIAAHGIEFGRDVGRPQPWGGRYLVSLYHPSGQTLGRRSRGDQLRDYRIIAAWQQAAVANPA